MTTKATSGQLKDFAIWINSYCTEHALAESSPLVNGQQWVLSTRQFRRTLDWFIARRPGGAITCRHLSIQMFEGYTGTSDSGFGAEVEAEQALARGEDLMSIATDHPHTVTGPAAAFTGTVITDSTRIKRLMKRSEPAIYPGTFALCVFDPDKALCQQELGLRAGPTATSTSPTCSGALMVGSSAGAWSRRPGTVAMLRRRTSSWALLSRPVRSATASTVAMGIDLSPRR